MAVLPDAEGQCNNGGYGKRAVFASCAMNFGGRATSRHYVLFPGDGVLRSTTNRTDRIGRDHVVRLVLG